MVAEDNQTLFRCKDRRTFFPDLGGFSFNVKSALKSLDDDLCAFAGNQCSVDGMIEFIAQYSNSPDGYQFGVTGMMFILPHRISSTSIPTVPIMDGRMVLLGPRTKSQKKKYAFRRMVSPFQIDAWLSILGVAFVFLFLWLLISWSFQDPVHFRDVAGIMVRDLPGRFLVVPGEYPQDLGVLEENIQLANRFAFNTLKLSVKVFLAITVLFYEIAVVYYIFEERGRTETIDIQGLKKSEMAKYIVIRGGAQEFVFRKSGTFFSFSSKSGTLVNIATLTLILYAVHTVDPDGKWDPTFFPWNRCKDLEEWYAFFYFLKSLC